MKLFFTKLILGTAFCGTAFSVAAQEAAIGSTEYATLAEAFAAAQKNDVVDLLKDVDCKTALEINNDMTFNLNGHTITNNVANSRFFRLGDAKFTIEGKGGAITTPESNTKSYGLVDFQNMSGAASASASLVAKDLTVSGDTDEGSMFRLRSSGQSIELDNCNVTMAGKTNNFSVINGYRLTDIKMTVNGGVYDYSSANKSAGMFQAGANSTVTFSGATLTCDGGPVYECVGADATFTDCNVTNNTSTTPSYLNACLAVSNGGEITIDGGSYTGDTALYVYNSGGSMVVEDGTFTGAANAIQVDATSTATSHVEVNGGTFNGGIKVAEGDNADLQISGGNFDAPNVGDYCVDGFEPVLGEDGRYQVEGISTSVTEIAVPGQNIKHNGVYNLSGLRVAETVEGLQPGIYVVDGKKVYVK